MSAARVEPLRVARDARGAVVEPLLAHEFALQRNAHLVLTAPGAVRGNHYHELGTEVMMVLGPALVRLREGGAIRDVLVPADEAWRFTVPPRVSHAVQATGDAPLVLVSFNTLAHDPAAPDVVRDVLIDP